MVKSAAEDKRLEALRQQIGKAGTIKYIMGYLLRMTRGDKNLAGELTAITLGNAIVGAGTFESCANLRTWLVSIAKNVVAGHFQKLERKPAPVSLDELIERGQSFTAPNRLSQCDCCDDPAVLCQNKALGLMLLECILSLESQKCKDIIILRYICGMSYKEIATFLSLNLNTVKTRLHRARAAFRKIYDERERSED